MTFFRPNDDELIIAKGPVSFHYRVDGLNKTVENDLTTKYILIPQDIPNNFQPKTLDLKSILYHNSINLKYAVFWSKAAARETAYNLSINVYL